MGEGTRSIGETPRERAERLESEIDGTRDELAVLLSELDRRRKEALDLAHQVRKRAVPAVVASAVAAFAAGYLVSLALRARARRRSDLPPREQMRRLRIALNRAIAHPDYVARKEPGVGSQLMRRAVMTGAGVLVGAAVRSFAGESAEDVGRKAGERVGTRGAAWARRRSGVASRTKPAPVTASRAPASPSPERAAHVEVFTPEASRD